MHDRIEPATNAADFSRVGCAVLPDGEKSRLYEVFGGLFAGSYPVSQRKERTTIAIVEEFHCTDIPSTNGIDQVLIADHVVRIGYIHTLLRRFVDTMPTVWLYHIREHFSPSNVGKLKLALVKLLSRANFTDDGRTRFTTRSPSPPYKDGTCT